MNGKIYVYFNKKKYEDEGIKKYYVGQTTRSIEERAGRNGWKYCKSGNTKFSNSIKKWGWDSFEVTVLEEGIKTLEELNEREMYYINLYNSYENGYNSTMGGDGVLGCHHSGMYNKKHTEEAKEKNRLAHIGLLKGEKHPMYGIPKTDEEKEKIRKGLERFRKENPNADCNRKTIPVYCEELKMRFESIKEATDYMKSKYNLCMKNLTRNMKGLVSYCGVIMIDGKKTKLHWNYVNIEDKEFSSKLAHVKTKAESESNSKRMINNDYAKKSSVYCVELDITFKSITEAQKYIKENYNENCHNISAVCRGLREACGIILLNGEYKKLHWKYI